MKLDGLGSLMLRVTSMTTARTRASGETAVAKETPQEKWLREWREAMAQQALVKQIKSSARQVAANMVGLLKQRLEAIKAQLRFASPEMARRLAKELKSIASELASVAKTLGSDSGGRSEMTNPVAGASAAQAASATSDGQGDAHDATNDSSESAAAVAATTGGSAVGVGATAPEDKANETTHATSERTSVSAAQGGQGDDDAALKALLRDARKLLKEAIDQLKARLAQHPDHDMKRDIEAAEKGLADMDKALAQSDAAMLYTSQGAIDSAASISTVSGNVVDFAV